jgi:class 3 adenylate cyclase
MRRLRPLDIALLVTLVPLWLGSFALYLQRVVRGDLTRVPVFIWAPKDANTYPIVRGFRPGTGAEAVGLRVGDQLLRVGEADLRGVGPLGFVARAYEAADAELRVSLVFSREGARRDVLLPLSPLAAPWSTIPLTLGFGITAVLVLLRAPGSRLARAFFLANLVYSLQWTFFHSGVRLQTYVWAGVFTGASLLMFPLALRAVLLFPEEVVPPGTRLPVWPWLFAVIGPISTSLRFGVPPLPPTLALRVYLLVTVMFITTLLGLLARSFRRAGPVGRRQLKWVVFGIYIGTLPVLAVDVFAVYDPSLWRFHDPAVAALGLIPFCVLMAIVRFNLFDIDRLISATAAYTILSVLLVAGALTLIPRLSQAASSTVGVDPATGQVVFSLLLAAVVVPGQRYLRPQIERVFFAERYALEQGVDRLLRELSASAGPQALLTLAGEQLDVLLRPECCVIYGQSGVAYTPVFVRGRAVPPAFEASSSLVARLQTQVAPVDVEQWRRRPAGVPLAPADRAALDSLGAAVVLPLGRLTAFMCLGQKRSGDVYTVTDLALLAAIAEKMSGELRLFDEADIRRQAQAMQDALRRYVPGAIAAQVVSGGTLEAGEREVSVLFVDIRGYTTYSEGRTAAEIFSTVNRYTETVSQVVRHYGGTIVEFNGDGMMTVFGAPESLAQKERAAVEAGRAIVAAVRSLVLGLATPGSRPLEVGVGIATGSAFVGNIQSVDRLIWSAIGNTTNLAARLQSLTRDLGAALVIDATTWSEAGDTAADFELHAHMPIRGRHQTIDVYALPLAVPVVRGGQDSMANS